MPGINLGGDDVKNVSYWITFVKPDFVTTLQGVQDETIDYATDEGSFGGLKLGDFLQALRRGTVPWPQGWGGQTDDEEQVKRPSLKYVRESGMPPEQPRYFLADIPVEDRRYIRFNMRLNWRQPLPDAEREKDKMENLREIRDALR